LKPVKRKKLAINLLNFSDHQIAGAAIFAKNLIGGWFATDISAYDITIYHSGNINVKELFAFPEHSNIHYVGVAVNSFWLRILYEQVILPFTLRRFDIYFAPTPVMPLLSPFFNRGLKHIITIHDLIPFFVKDKYGKGRSRYVKFISVYGAKLASEVITVSENSKEDIKQLAEIDPNKITVIYNFMPELTRRGKLSYEPFFISISTIEPGKNIENTIKGFKLFLERTNRPEFKFYWLGKIGWGYSASILSNLINSLGLEKSFLLLGYVNDEQKSELLSKCCAMVYLSHYEGFGLPVLEALYYNKPAVVSNTSSLPEVIGRAGILCDKDNVTDIADALVRVTEELDTFVGEIPAQMKKFSQTAQVEKLIKILEKGQ
jgi:glycosyltransferase involved in cell wall biosynthesis